MEEHLERRKGVFRDLTDRKDVLFEGCGEFELGLSLEGGSIVVQQEDIGAPYMPLLKVSAHDSGGYSLMPVNRDLPCIVNTQEVTGEINLINGTRISIAEKTLMFIDGPVPRMRRHLPPTPGLPRQDSPPDKPLRKLAPGGEEEDQKWLDSSWTKLDMSTAEQNWLDNLNTPEQISIMAASYFCKQVRVFTDASLTIDMMDDIFHLFQDVIVDYQEVFMRYLSDISTALGKVPNCTQTRPMHGPAIRLLTDLLNHCLEPVSKVVLLLGLLRTFSHFDSNLDTMVKLKTSGPVLGSMSIYKDVADVQAHGLDILVKIATYRPEIGGKIPLREGCIMIVLNGVKHHMDDVNVCRSACRVLANLAAALVEAVNGWMDTETSQDEQAVDMVMLSESLMLKLFEDAIPTVQEILKRFHGDLGVNTEGRRFIYYYAKLPQLQQKKRSWICSSPPGILKPAGSYECLKTATRRLSFVPDTMGGSDSESDSSSDDSFSGPPFETDIPMLMDMEEDFSCHLVRHLIQNTLKRRRKKSKSKYSSDDSSSESSDEEFLKQLPIKSKLPILPDMVADRSLSDNGNLSHNPMVLLASGNTAEPVIQSPTGTVGQNGNTVNERNFENKVEIKPVSDVSDENVDNTHVEIGKNSEQCFPQKVDMDEGLQKNNETVDNTQVEIITNLQQHVAQKADMDEGLDENDESFDNTSVEIDTNLQQCSLQKADNGDGLRRNIDGASEAFIASENSLATVETMTDETDGALCSGTDHIIKASQRMAEVVDVSYLGKLVRTQIIVHVGALVFQGDDTRVLSVIDQPIVLLLERSMAPPGLLKFACSQYGNTMTLMDLEPAIVISVIDAVRYRTVTSQMVQSAVLSLTRAILHTLHTSSVDTTMLFYRALFADPHLTAVLTEPEFLQTFKTCFQNATERLEKTHPVEEIRRNLAGLV